MLSTRGLILVILLIRSVNIFPQDSILSGKIRGVSEGKIFLVNAWDNQIYNSTDPLIDSAIITNYGFKFKKNVRYLRNYPYYLIVQSPVKNGETGMVFIDNNSQFIEIDTLDPHIAPKNFNSDNQNEIKGEYEPTFSRIIKRSINFNLYLDSLTKDNKTISASNNAFIEENIKEIIQAGDTLLFNYALAHPNSLISFWKLNERYHTNSFKPIYKATFDILNDSLRNSTIGVFFKNELLKSSVLSTGSSFPEITFQDEFKNDFIIQQKSFFSKYTLVNFWFSTCKPCLVEFPNFSYLTKRYPKSLFSIIGVSTDEENEFDKWKNMIKQINRENWSNYWDKAGIIEKNLRIHRFPSNILVNDKGLIIKKNISITELTSLVEDAYKKVYFLKVIMSQNNSFYFKWMVQLL